MIKITFPDGSVREYSEGVNGLQIAESISSRLAQDVLACGVDGGVFYFVFSNLPVLSKQSRNRIKKW